MVSAVPGALINCDVPIKEVILSLNNSRPEADKFILEDLDETRLLVKANCLDWLREELAKFQNKNTYEPPRREDGL